VANSNAILEGNQGRAEGNLGSRFRALADLDLNMNGGEEDMPEDFQSLHEENFLDYSNNNKENVLDQAHRAETIHEPNAGPNRRAPPLSNAHSGTAPTHMQHPGPTISQTQATHPATEPRNLPTSYVVFRERSAPRRNLPTTQRTTSLQVDTQQDQELDNSAPRAIERMRVSPHSGDPPDYLESHQNRGHQLTTPTVHLTRDYMSGSGTEIQSNNRNDTVPMIVRRGSLSSLYGSNV